MIKAKDLKKYSNNISRCNKNLCYYKDRLAFHTLLLKNPNILL